MEGLDNKSAWDFVEKYYPNYHSCNDILECDALVRIIDGQWKEGDSAWEIREDIIDYCGSDDEGIITDGATERLNELEAEIYKKSIEAYIASLNQTKGINESKKLNNMSLQNDLERINDYDDPIVVSKKVDHNLDFLFIIDVEDNGYFYSERESRDEDYESLKKILPYNTLFE